MIGVGTPARSRGSTCQPSSTVGACSLVSSRHYLPVKLALHRSITFWCGILVMAAIAWAWQDSKENSAQARFWRCAFGNQAEGVCAAWYSKSVSNPKAERYQAILEPSIFESSKGTALIFVDSDDAEPTRRKPLMSRDEGTIALFIPHWLVLLVVAAPWTGFVIWRSKRSEQPYPHPSDVVPVTPPQTPPHSAPQ